jgi:hypothetical protein
LDIRFLWYFDIEDLITKYDQVKHQSKGRRSTLHELTYIGMTSGTEVPFHLQESIRYHEINTLLEALARSIRKESYVSS